jgi:hypothetical protein
MRSILWRSHSAVLAVSLAAAGTAAVSGEARRGEAAVTCTNTASGVSWQVKIDYDKRTVDSNPARFSDTRISWHDATDGGNYTLDRKSGKLTVIFASSTAGHFIYDQCALED